MRETDHTSTLLRPMDITTSSSQAQSRRNKTSRNSKLKTWQKIVLGILALFLVTLIGISAYAYTTYSRIFVTSNVTKPSATPIPPVDAFNNLQPYSVLLMGYGGGGHAGGKLTDTMILVFVHPEQKHIYLVSIPRDLWVPLEVSAGTESYWKINAAYALGSDDKGYPHKPPQFTGPAGGGEMAKSVVEKVTGLHVDRFVALSFAGFQKSIDVLKGVNVKVEKTFDDFQYPIEGKEDDPCGKTPEEIQATVATLSATLVEKEFTCRYEHLHFDKGLTHMDGATALKYVRSRHSAQSGGDFERSARQRTLLLAVKERVLSLDFFPKIVPFISSLTWDMQTDIPPQDMEMALKYKDDLMDFQISSIALTQDNVLEITKSSNGQSILAPKAGQDNWQSIHDWLKDEFAKAATSSATTVTATSSATPSTR